MKNRFSNKLILIGITVLPFALSGCTMNRINPEDRGVISIEPYDSSKVYIAWNSAYKQGDGFVITGVLRRRDSIGMPIRTHVDVTILSPGGKILNKARSGDMYVSRRIAGRSYLSFERFKVRFPKTPEEGSSVHLVCHSGPHNGS